MNVSFHYLTSFEMLEEYENNSTYWTEYRIYVYGLIPICGAGIVLNLVASYYLYNKTHKNSSIRVCLISLTVLDAAQLLFTVHSAFPFLCDMERVAKWGLCRAYRMFLAHALNRISATVDTAHMWAVVALTAHRYWKISHPLHSQIHDTGNKAKLIIGTACVAAVIFRIPMYCEVSYSFESVSLTANLRHFSVTKTYNVLYYLVLNTLLYNLIPFLTLTILNVLILRSLFIARLAVRKDSLHNHRELRAAAAICAIVTLFLLFHSLFIYDVMKKWKFWILEMPLSPWDHYDAIFASISVLLAAISSALNPFIYIALGTGCRICHRRLSQFSGSSEAKQRNQELDKEITHAHSRNNRMKMTKFIESVVHTDKQKETECVQLMISAPAEDPSDSENFECPSLTRETSFNC